MFPHGFTMPGTSGLVYLAYLFLDFPWAALRNARRMRAAADAAAAAAPDAGLPSRTRIWIGSLVAQALLFLLAWLVWLTGWLVRAMIVRALYDFRAGWTIRREALRADASAAPTALA